MSVITMVVDAATEREVPKAKGIIKRISIKPINADGSPKISVIPSGPKKGTQIKKTHRYSILLEAGGDSQWISVGEEEVKNQAYVDQFQIKIGDKYTNLYPGMEIIIYPVEIRKYKAKNAEGVEEERTAQQGKKKDIKLVNDHGVTGPAASAPAAGAATANTTHKPQSGGGTKVFGEIINITDGVATIEDKTGPVNVVLGEHAAAVIFPGRLGAIVDAQGNILGNFKPYGPVQVGGGAGKPTQTNKGSYKKDDTGVRTGNALNVVALMMNYTTLNQFGIMVRSEYILMVLDNLRAKLAPEFPSMSDTAFGSTLGLAAKLVAPRFDAGSSEVPEGFDTQVEEMFRDMVKFEEAMKLKAKTATEAAQAAQVVDVPATTSPDVPPAHVVDNPPVNSYDSPQTFDFDDDIPF